jgi:hypothetical protein
VGFRVFGCRVFRDRGLGFRVYSSGLENNLHEEGATQPTFQISRFKVRGSRLQTGISPSWSGTSYPLYAGCKVFRVQGLGSRVSWFTVESFEMTCAEGVRHGPEPTRPRATPTQEKLASLKFRVRFPTWEKSHLHAEDTGVPRS